MSQEDVQAFLEDFSGKSFTPRKIAKMTGLSYNAVIRALTSMKDHNEVNYRENPKRHGTYFYWL